MAIARGVRFILLFMIAAVIVSMTGVAVSYFLLTRGPAVESDSVLWLRIPANLGEQAPDDVFGFLDPARDGRLGRRRAAQGEGRRQGVGSGRGAAARAGTVGQRAGDPGRRGRLQGVGQADRRPPRVRHGPGVLPGDGVRRDLHESDQPADAGRRGVLRALLSRDARQGGNRGGHAGRGRVQDRDQRLHRVGVHPGAPRGDRGAEPGLLRAARRRHRRGTRDDAGAGPRRHRPGSVRGGRRGQSRPDRRSGLRGRAARPAGVRRRSGTARFRDLPARRAGERRPGRRTPDRRRVRRRDDQLRIEHAGLSRFGADGRRADDDRGDSRRAGRPVHRGHRAANRQPRAGRPPRPTSCGASCRWRASGSRSSCRTEGSRRDRETSPPPAGTTSPRPLTPSSRSPAR